MRIASQELTLKKPIADRIAQRLALTALALLLSACGGGGGGASSEPTPTPTPAPSTPPALSSQCESGSVARLVQEAAAQVGRNTELALLACGSGELSQLRWAQSGGSAALQALSTRSQAISVEPASAGSYPFDLSYVDRQGRAFTAPVQLNVLAATAGATPALVLRGEPSVLAGGSLSLRAWSPGLSSTEMAQASVRWTQVDGPAAALGDATGWRLLFSAPQVSSDAVLRLRATLTLADGSVSTGQFSLLVQAQTGLPADPLFSAAQPASRVYPYLPQGPAAQALSDCIYSPRLSRSNPNNLCTLGRLPLLGQTPQATPGSAPTVEQVMQRVLVSNDWMGEVFERFLREQDGSGDFRRMLASVTSIVIGGRVRPAFYWNATGAIYLDASYLWLTPAQRDSVSETPDPRSNYGALLGFATPWRYVLDNRHAVTSYAVLERQTRALDELRFELGRLLYHELTHAADFLPPRTHASLNNSLRVYEASPALTASQDLANRLPFYSSPMQGLARVLSFGDAPNSLQIGYTPADITQFFSQDRVNDDYSYSVAAGSTISREDAAMLVEEALVQLRYGVLRDVAVTNKLALDASSADLIVHWGQRGRIGEAAIKPRLQLVLADLMPWLAADFSDRLLAPQPLRAGLSWGANLDQAAVAAARVRPLSAQARLNELEQTTRELRSR
jgi:hypothetical protein